MKIVLEVENTTISREEERRICVLLNLHPHEEFIELQQLLSRLQQQVTELEKKSDKAVIGTHGGVSQSILNYIERVEIATPEEIMAATGLSMSQVRTNLQNLKHKRKVCASSTRPKKYFLSGRPNPELTECLIKGAKASRFG